MLYESARITRASSERSKAAECQRSGSGQGHAALCSHADDTHRKVEKNTLAIAAGVFTAGQVAFLPALCCCGFRSLGGGGLCMETAAHQGKHQELPLIRIACSR